jgi:hypothetical protein
MRNFGPVERIRVPFRRGQHFGADSELQKMLFVPGVEDPLWISGRARVAGAMFGAHAALPRWKASALENRLK